MFVLQVQAPDDDLIDAWNMGKMSCVGSDCFDGTHHGGVHTNGGMQPYDDYHHMNGDDNSVAARHHGRRPPSLAQRMQNSQEQEHVEEEHAQGLTVMDPRLDRAALSRPPSGPSDDYME